MMRKILLSFLLCFPLMVWAAFNDVDSNNTYYDAFSYVQSESIVDGYSDGTYRPDQTINRVEFLKILLESQAQAAATCRVSYNYTDVDWNSWYGSYVQKASCLNIVEGYSDNTFKPAAFINYAEAVSYTHLRAHET